MDIFRPIAVQREDAAGPCRTTSTSSEKAPKKHAWSFINVSRSSSSRKPSPKRDREQDSLPKLKSPSFDFRSRSSAISSAPETRTSSPEPQLPARPRSSRGPSLLQVPNFSKTTSSRRGSLLPTILETKINTASMESLRSRVAGAKVKRWDGRTRTSSPWNGIRKVSITATMYETVF
jgi:hypothetical protein